jgi:hypothetical protein
MVVMWTNLSNDSHDSGKIRFWDASSVALRLLLSFYVGDDQSSAEERRKTSTSTASGEVRATPQFITVFHFCPVSRILVLGCLSGSIFFYKFTYSPPITFSPGLLHSHAHFPVQEQAMQV